MLQSDIIKFTPNLPEDKIAAIKDVTVWGGCKAFIEFSESFYPTATAFGSEPETAGHRLYYDAAYGQNTSKHILGLFAVGQIADPYLEREGEEKIEYILNELDELFDGNASDKYVNHIFQNWTEKPYINGAYIHYFEDWKNIRTLGQPIADKVFFAGDGYTDGSDWSSVHAAAEAAINVVQKLVAN